MLSAQFFDGREGICLIRFLFMSWLVAHSKHKNLQLHRTSSRNMWCRKVYDTNGRVHILGTKFNVCNIRGIISSK